MPDGVGTNEIARRNWNSKTCVQRWQRGFASEGFDKPARGGAQRSPVRPLGSDIVARAVALRLEAPTGETTRWTGAPTAKASGFSGGSVRRV